ncbi:MAG: beta-galactosidase [bacterium]|nr:beta-galactosidase [bacterium]
MNEFLHGGDYNPDQWLKRPEILEEDIRLMKKAGVNEVSLGIFSWAMYEPEEDVYQFSWMDKIMDAMYENGIKVILATPSAARPAWMVKKYPEIMRVNEKRERLLYGDRENYCCSSEIYREKVKKIDGMIASRYAKHPALIMWHLSNEMYGECHCEKCQNKFREWLKKKYKTLENLNEQYNSAFWSHTFYSWDEIESPSSIGDQAVHGLALDFSRFYSELNIDFLEMEKKEIRKYCKHTPITTNMLSLDCGIDYSDLGKILDVTSWDSYPLWHCGKDKTSEWKEAVKASFHYDYCRSLKKQPFYLMESTPSNTNWAAVCKLKRPGMHLLSSMQAIASGSDSVLYFQWRQGKGGYEKFHGAVVGHSGSEDTRVFRDVCQVGDELKKIAEIKGAGTISKVAIIFDWPNLRALKGIKGLKNNKKDFVEALQEYYEALIKNYVNVDIISQRDDFSEYQLIVAPMLYLFEKDTDKRIKAYIENGGNFVLGVFSGIVNENDLAFECFPPYGLQDVFGLCVEETDALCEDEFNEVTYKDRTYHATDYCDLIRNQDATVVAEYGQDFYKGMPVVTKHTWGKGTAVYIGSRMNEEFLYEFLHDMIQEVGIERICDTPYISDIMVKQREKKGIKYTFLMNFSTEQRVIEVEHQQYVLGCYEYKIITTK